jgi:Tfp pilus assembly PilM family ATPase
MFLNFFSKNNFSPSSFGLDISDELIKFVLLVSNKHGIYLERYGTYKIPPMIVERGEIKDFKKLAEHLSIFRKKEGIKSVRTSLTTKEMHIFKNSSIKVTSFEPESQALTRVAIKKGDQGTYMIVDFGEKRTRICVVSKGFVMSDSMAEVGGITLTNILQFKFNISFSEAEELKKLYGLQRNMDNQEVSSVLLSGVSVLRDAIERVSLHWHMYQDEEGKKNPSIKKIILCGGDANLIGLADYLSVSLKTKVEMVNVWINILDPKKKVPKMSLNETFSFAVAIGLALRNFE